MVEDVSERTIPATPGRMAEILDAVDSGITVQDDDLRLIYVNRAAAILCGWSSPEEMLAAPTQATLDRFELIDESGLRSTPLTCLAGVSWRARIQTR